MKRTITILVLAAPLWLVANTGRAQAPPPPAGLRTIEVSGTGEARATPDQAFLDVAVETHAATASEASKHNAELSQRVMEALKARLGDKDKIWTGGYSLNAEYGPGPRPDQQKLTGYRAENSISLQTGSIDQAGSLIDAAVAAGANRVNSLSFGLKDEAPARTEAIAKASKDAQAQAQALATSLGLKLKRIVYASTGGAPRPIPYRAELGGFGAMRMSAAPPTPVQPNEVSVPTTVALVYEID